MAALNDIINWFLSGKIPTGDQFRQAWQSYRHKDEKVPIADVDGLLTQLNNKLGANHASDEAAHTAVLLKKDGSNLTDQNKLELKAALEIPESGLENITSEDQSLFIENDNIESNISMLSEEFETVVGDLVVLSFPAIQIIGVFDGGIKLNSTQYNLDTTQRITLIAPRVGDYIEVLYTHLKTDL